MSEAKPPNREHHAEFRIEIAQRMLAGENVMALSKQYQLARSLMYRWRDRYRKHGVEGMQAPIGRPKPVPRSSKAGKQPTEERLRQRIAELERKVGQQAVEIDFFKGVFRRLEELPKAKRHGGEASTTRSGE